MGQTSLMQSKLKDRKKTCWINIQGFFRMTRSEPDIHTVDKDLCGGDRAMADWASDPGQITTRRGLSTGQGDIVNMPIGVSGIFSSAAHHQRMAGTEMVAQVPAPYNLRHPWGIVDYHLYLASIECGKDEEIRRNNVYLYDGTDCEPVRYEDLFEDETYNTSGKGSRPVLLFAILPIADKTADFEGKCYVLGYDWQLRSFFARSFNWLPGHITDIWAVWGEGLTVYSITIPRLFSLLQTVFLERAGKVGEGILSSSSLCRSLQMNDDPGMEMVIATLFTQFAEDFLEVIFVQEGWQIEKFKHQLNKYGDQCRQVLQRASQRAWFAIRSGSSEGRRYRYKEDFKRFTNDLYTFEESEREVAARMEKNMLQNGGCQAPDFETCEKIREQIRQERREAAVQRLERLFAIPDDLPPMESPGKAFERMMARTSENPIPAVPYPPTPEAPRTPSPMFRHRSATQEFLSPCSPGIVRPANEEYDGFEVTEYHKIPLKLLLRRTLDLLEERPDLDSLENRARFGSLYSEIGLGIHKKPTDELALASPIGYENDSWTLEVQSETDTEVHQPRRLLPAPRLD